MVGTVEKTVGQVEKKLRREGLRRGKGSIRGPRQRGRLAPDNKEMTQ
jgi:hypothetical protein